MTRKRKKTNEEKGPSEIKNELEIKQILLQEKSAQFEEKSAKLEKKRAELEEKSAELEEKSAELDEKSVKLEEKSAELKKKSAELEENKLVFSVKEQEMDKMEMKMLRKEDYLYEREEDMFRKDRCMFRNRWDKLEKKEQELVKNVKEQNNKRLDELDIKLKELDMKAVELANKDNYLNTKEADIGKLKKLAQEVTDKLECPVCMETPRIGPVPVCTNGHFVCSKCKTASCPTCRIPMGDGKSFLALIVLENIDHTCRFEDCGEKFSFEDIENHAALCPYRIVTCPKPSCPVRVPLPKLVDHCLGSEACCLQTNGPIKFKDIWYTSCYPIKNIQNLQANCRMGWNMDLFSFSGETFAVFPIVLCGQFYFVVVMLTTEKECTKYKFEIVVHDGEKDVENSEMIARFEGQPFSIDVAEEELYVYGTSLQFMKKLLRKSSKNKFALSFKISKKR